MMHEQPVVCAILHILCLLLQDIIEHNDVAGSERPRLYTAWCARLCDRCCSGTVLYVH